jgi:hypothetical protein
MTGADLTVDWYRWNLLDMRERIKRLVMETKQVVKRCELEPPRFGFRYVRAFVEDGRTFEWYQPWLP